MTLQSNQSADGTRFFDHRARPTRNTGFPVSGTDFADQVSGQNLSRSARRAIKAWELGLRRGSVPAAVEF